MRRILLALIVVTVGVACHTITEELPSRPDPIVAGGGQPLAPPPAPVIVIPVPAPTPVVVEQPAAPNPAPNNPPPGGGGGGGGGGNPSGQIPTNTNPAVRLGAKVFFVECNGREIPGSEGSTQAQIGCRIHYDVTPKDAQNQHTQVREIPRWTFSPANIAGGVGGKTQFTPTVSATGPGTLTAYCEADGVRSNDVRITFHN
jgi:hypothetical protein